MKAMILAAGLGKRMRPLTDNTPKPLLQACGKSLIEYHLDAIARAGIKEVIINTHWCADRLEKALESGDRWGLSIEFSHEEILLETAGGIAKALPFLQSDQDEPFLLINGDIYCEQNLSDWIENAESMSVSCLGYLALVPNPSHNLGGDFPFDEELALLLPPDSASRYPMFTYAGLALFRPSLFKELPIAPSRLSPLLQEAIILQQIRGQLITATWVDVGTPERLHELDQMLKTGHHPN